MLTLYTGGRWTIKVPMQLELFLDMGLSYNRETATHPVTVDDFSLTLVLTPMVLGALILRLVRNRYNYIIPLSVVMYPLATGTAYPSRARWARKWSQVLGWGLKTVLNPR